MIFSMVNDFPFVAPLNHTGLVDEEVLGSKFSAEFRMFFFQSDDDALAVGPVAADGGQELGMPSTRTG